MPVLGPGLAQPYAGLGTLSETALGTYTGLEHLDIQRQMAGMGNALKAAEIANMMRKVMDDQRKIGAHAYFATHMQGVAPEDQPAKVQELLSRGVSELGPEYGTALAEAAKGHGEAVGGYAPPTKLVEWDANRKVAHAVDMYSHGSIGEDAVVSEAMRNGMKLDEILRLLPNTAARQPLADAWAKATGSKVGEATGLLTTPGGIPAMPGRPAPAQGQPGYTVPTTKPSGAIEAAQAGNVAGAQAGGAIAGSAETRASTMPQPFPPMTYGQAEAGQKGLITRQEALGAETPMKQAQAQADIALKEAEILMHQATTTMAPETRVLKAAQAQQALVMAGVFGSMLTDPIQQARYKAVSEQYNQILNEAGKAPSVVTRGPGAASRIPGPGVDFPPNPYDRGTSTARPAMPPIAPPPAPPAPAPPPRIGTPGPGQVWQLREDATGRIRPYKPAPGQMTPPPGYTKVQ